MNSILRCPVCSEQLAVQAKTLFCAKNHSFDRAKEGYVNLSLPKKGQPRVDGDTAPMIAARREFFELGEYDFLSKKLLEIAEQNELLVDGSSLLDSGCGEGTFLAAFQGQSLQRFGVDVSKAALRSAAKRDKDAEFFLANVHIELPFLDNSLDLILNVLAPRNFEEFFRVLAPGAALLVVFPNSNHLAELRESYPILEIPGDKREKVISAAEGFELISEHSIEKRSSLGKRGLELLLTMTPNFHHLDVEVKDQTLELGYSLHALCFKKTS